MDGYIQNQGWLTMYAWNGSAYTILSGTETITSWEGYVFDNTDGVNLTVTFGYPTS